MTYLEAILKYKRIVIVDQQDIEKEYGITWEDLGPFEALFYKSEYMISDSADEDGFETVVFEAEIEGHKIRCTIVYGIGSIIEFELL